MNYLIPSQMGRLQWSISTNSRTLIGFSVVRCSTRARLMHCNPPLQKIRRAMDGQRVFTHTRYFVATPTASAVYEKWLHVVRPNMAAFAWQTNLPNISKTSTRQACSGISGSTCWRHVTNRERAGSVYVQRRLSTYISTVLREGPKLRTCLVSAYWFGACTLLLIDINTYSSEEIKAMSKVCVVVCACVIPFPQVVATEEHYK